MKRLTTILLAMLALFSVLDMWRYGDKASGIDFYQFWAVGQALRTMPVDNIYGAADRQRVAQEIARRGNTRPEYQRHRAAARDRPVLETYSTPFLYAALAVFGSPRYETAFQTYRLFTLLCTVTALLLLCRILGFALPETLLLMVVFTGWFEPLLSDMRVTNVNQPQLALVALAAWVMSRAPSSHRDVLSGLTLGVAVAFKPNLLFVAGLPLLWWLFARDWRRLGYNLLGCGLAALLALVASTILFGSLRCWLDWLTALRRLPMEISTVEMGNYSLAMFLRQLADLDVRAALLIALPLLGAGFVYAGRKRTDDPAKIVAVLALGCLTYLLSGELVWLHYYWLTVPALLLLLRPDQNELSLRRIVALLGFLLLTATLPLDLIDPYLIGVMCISGALLLTIHTLWETARA